MLTTIATRLETSAPHLTPQFDPTNLPCVTGFEVSLTQTRIGVLLLARTQQGICALSLGQDEAELLAGLAPKRREQVRAHLAIERPAPDQDATLAQWIVAMAASNPSALLQLKLDLDGTDFQTQAWAALRQIPAGRTWSYRKLATALGKPEAVRAVARACGANPVALLVPCHRVIGSNGKLTGYRWGIERKQTLLAWESALEPKSKLRNINL